MPRSIFSFQSSFCDLVFDVFGIVVIEVCSFAFFSTTAGGIKEYVDNSRSYTAFSDCLGGYVFPT
jgi:hypothetical protein